MMGAWIRVVVYMVNRAGIVMGYSNSLLISNRYANFSFSLFSRSRQGKAFMDCGIWLANNLDR
jgi:hypothetical protein